jgi:voltage-gated potassium channel
MVRLVVKGWTAKMDFPGFGNLGQLRRWLYINLQPSAWPKEGLSPLNRIITALIFFAVAVAILETEPTISEGRGWFFRGTEAILAVVFTAEYLSRLWIAVENPAYGPGWRGRLRYAVSFYAIIDLLALLPLLVTFFGNESFLLRLVRLVRILRLARLGRFSTAIGAIMDAVRSRRFEMLTSLCVAFLLLLVSSTVLYILEGGLQPEHFGSIPRTMWWSIATLTTVGYGDVYPLTPLGKIFAGVTAITGIGLIALPTGILAGAFSDVMAKQRQERLDAEEARKAGEK